jgi:uncharacterized membrane protein
MRHPLHPALVHFPIACWTLATAGDIASLWWGKPAWMLSGSSLAVGTVVALAAMAAGFVELLKVDAGHPATRDLDHHMLFAMAAWSLYAASLLLRLQGFALTGPGAIELALGVAGFACLCATGWLGGKLVYGHGLGVQQAPRT